MAVYFLAVLLMILFLGLSLLAIDRFKYRKYYKGEEEYKLKPPRIFYKVDWYHGPNLYSHQFTTSEIDFWEGYTSGGKTFDIHVLYEDDDENPEVSVYLLKTKSTGTHLHILEDAESIPKGDIQFKAIKL